MPSTQKILKPERVMNGTYSTLWVDDEEMAEATGCQAKVAIEKTEVNQVGTLAKGHKITGTNGTGSIKMNKVSSFFIEKMSENIKAGKATVGTIRSKIEDPDSVGAEDLTLFGVTFDELTLIDWEAKKLLEENIPFTFTSWEISSTVDHDEALA